MVIRVSFACVLAFGIVGCGDDGRRVTRDTPEADLGPGGGGDGAVTGRDLGSYECTPTGEEGTPETCGDGVDNDCNGKTDCVDAQCSGVGSCPECGVVDTPLGAPLALPDGVGGNACSSDSDCPGDQRCFTIDGLFGPTQECRESYRSTLSFTGFGGAVFDEISDLESLCVQMEHSYLRDMEITLEAPNGARVRLQRFLGQEGGEIYLGEANDCDDDGAPSPGTGATYCWRPDASRESMLGYADGGGSLNSVSSCNGFDADQMPPGDYSAADDWGMLIGTPLNGDWTLAVTDLWPIDNGYIFEWSIAFDPNTVDDCSVPLI